MVWNFFLLGEDIRWSCEGDLDYRFMFILRKLWYAHNFGFNFSEMENDSYWLQIAFTISQPIPSNWFVNQTFKRKGTRYSTFHGRQKKGAIVWLTHLKYVMIRLLIHICCGLLPCQSCGINQILNFKHQRHALKFILILQNRMVLQKLLFFQHYFWIYCWIIWMNMVR